MKTHVRYAGHVPCPDCQEPLPRQLFDLSEAGVCPHCKTGVSVSVFPALFVDPAQEHVTGINRRDDEQAGCFFHPHKEAVVPCAGCGLFLCTLCDTEIADRHICPKCLENELKDQNRSHLVTRRPLHSRMAFALSVYPLVLLPFITLLTAPAALFVTVRYWKAPRSLVSGSRWRFVAAAVLAVLQMFAWIAIFSGALS